MNHPIDALFAHPLASIRSHVRARAIARNAASFCAPALVCAALIWPAQPALAQQFPQNGPKLVGTGATGNAGEGQSAAVSAAGNTALVGGYLDSGGVGAAWVFTRSGGVWNQQAKLIGTGVGGNAEQSYSAALSGDGNTAILGGPFDSTNLGAAWVFARNGATWSQQAKLVDSSAAGDVLQGWSVALSGDGNTAIVGGPNDDSNGAAWVFTRSGGTWTQQAKLVGIGATGNATQGRSVALSADGNTALVGGDHDNGGAGAAWVFTRSGTTWTQQAKLSGTGAMGTANQGWSVALAGDGNTAILGGYNDNGGFGAAWVFVAPATTTHDFNSDCLSDIAWRDSNSGTVAGWLMNGLQTQQTGAYGTVAGNWTIVGQRDFNGDGITDLLWRDSSDLAVRFQLPGPADWGIRRGGQQLDDRRHRRLQRRRQRRYPLVSHADRHGCDLADERLVHPAEWNARRPCRLDNCRHRRHQLGHRWHW